MGEFWKDKIIFITGATGLLGSWLTDRLVREGADIVCLVRDHVPTSNFYLLGLDRRVNVVRGDITELALLERILNEFEIDTVFHLAAQANVLTANRSPISTFETNIRGTWSVLEASRLCCSVRRIVLASSDKAYGDHEVLPYREETPLCPTNFYDVSKASADFIAQAYYKSFRLPVAIVRCGNFFGGGDLNFSRIVPGTIKSALEGTAPIIRSDGQYVRDYIYVLDAVEAYLLVAQRIDPPPGIAGEAFNFSNEEPVKVLDLVEKILNLMGKGGLKPKISASVSGEIFEQFLSSQKSREQLGWKSVYKLDAGLDETIAWYQEFFAGKITRR